MYKVYHFNSFLKDFPKPQALQALQTISDGIRQYQMISEKIRRIRRCQKNQMISGGIRGVKRYQRRSGEQILNYGDVEVKIIKKNSARKYYVIHAKQKS